MDIGNRIVSSEHFSLPPIAADVFQAGDGKKTSKTPASRTTISKMVAEIAKCVPLSNPKNDKATILENAVQYLEYFNKNVTNVDQFNAAFTDFAGKNQSEQPEATLATAPLSETAKKVTKRKPSKQRDQSSRKKPKSRKNEENSSNTTTPAEQV